MLTSSLFLRILTKMTAKMMARVSIGSSSAGKATANTTVSCCFRHSSSIDSSVDQPHNDHNLFEVPYNRSRVLLSSILFFSPPPYAMILSSNIRRSPQVLRRLLLNSGSIRQQQNPTSLLRRGIHCTGVVNGDALDMADTFSRRHGKFTIILCI